MDDEFVKITYNIIGSQIILQKQIESRESFFDHDNMQVANIPDDQIEEKSSEIDRNLDKICYICMLKNEELRQAAGFKGHEKTHAEYPHLTRKECIQLDNSIKCLADKKGIAWQNKEIRQRHINIVERLTGHCGQFDVI